MWGQEHEQGSREKQAALSFIPSGSVRRSVLLYKMPDLASAHTNTWKIGKSLGAGAGRRGGWQHPARVVIHTQCSSAVPAFEGINLPSGLWNSHQGYFPFPLFFFYSHSGRHLHCAAGDLSFPPSSIFFITGVFSELLDPALGLLEEKSKAQGKWVAAQAVSPGGSGAAAGFSLCIPVLCRLPQGKH